MHPFVAGFFFAIGAVAAIVVLALAMALLGVILEGLEARFREYPSDG